MSEKKISDSDLTDLFTPGAGVVPPYLAGRKKEQAYFQACVKSLKNRRPISRDLILYGPRGNGKTALLDYLQTRTLQKEASKLDILWVTPDEIETLAELSDRLMEDQQTVRKRFKAAEISGGVGFIQAKTEVDLSPTSATIRKLLQERSRNKPLILVVDEAHTLASTLARTLLNASQSVRRAGNPFLLVLAGTPNLRVTLGQANASFWDRSEIIPLGRLSPDEASQALTVPLQAAGITFASGVVEEIVIRTHCYPFFTQVWGDCLARKLNETNETEITTETIKAVEEEAIQKRNAMYQVRFDELDRMGLLAVAESVADAFIRLDELALHRHALREAIERGMAGNEPITNERVMEKVEQLSHLGYIWPAGAYEYEPGIPSLMTFVHGYTLSNTRRKEAELHTTPSG